MDSEKCFDDFEKKDVDYIKEDIYWRPHCSLNPEEPLIQEPFTSERQNLLSVLDFNPLFHEYSNSEGFAQYTGRLKNEMEEEKASDSSGAFTFFDIKISIIHWEGALARIFSWSRTLLYNEWSSSRKGTAIKISF
jgi:hypothetical protein